MKTAIVMLLLAQQTKVTNTTPPAAIATRCVNAAGTAFEACGGGGSSGAVTQGTGIDGGRVWAVEGQVAVTNFPATQPVSGPLTDAQLRAAVVPVSLASTTVTGSVAVTGPLTDTQLRATPVPVSGSVTATVASTTITGTVAATQSGAWSDTPRQVASANNAGTCVSVTTSTTVLVSNASRRAYGFKASEDNTAKVHCKLGATATTSNTIFGAGAGWSQDTGAVYTGAIDCIAASGTQSVCAYEVN